MSIDKKESKGEFFMKAVEARKKSILESLNDPKLYAIQEPEQPPVPLFSESLEKMSLADLSMPEKLIDPWLPSRGITLLHAKAGTGKTFFAMTAAYALAIGKDFLHWKISKPRRVLYLDAEMEPAECINNFVKIGTMFHDDDTKLNENLEIVNFFRQKKYLNLSDKYQQEEILNMIREGKYEVMVLDNISMLCPEFRENEAHSWVPMQEFEAKVRHEGCSIIRIMHTGKGGLVRANSKVFDAVNTMIYLDRVPNDEDEMRAEFKVIFEKARGFYGDATRTVQMRLIGDENEIFHWDCETTDVCNFEKIIALVKEGIPARDIADELKLNKSVVSRAIKRGLAQYRIYPSDIKQAKRGPFSFK